MQDIVTTRQLAELLQVSPETIRSWVRTGKIPEIRLNSKVRRFSLDAVRAALSAKAGCSHD